MTTKVSISVENPIFLNSISSRWGSAGTTPKTRICLGNRGRKGGIREIRDGIFGARC